MATRAYNKTLVLDASFTLIKASTDSRLGQLDTSANSFTTRLGSHDISIAKLDASATSFTTRLGSHDTILDKLDSSASNYKVRLDQLDTSANSFTTRLGNHDTSIAKLDASATHFTTRLANVDSSAVKHDASFSDVYSKLSWQYILGTTQWDNYVDASFGILQVRIDGSFAEINSYNQNTYATIATTYTKTQVDASINNFKTNYVDPSLNYIKDHYVANSELASYYTKSLVDTSINTLRTYVDLSLNTNYYTQTQVNNQFASNTLVSSHTTSISKLDASATSFTTGLGQLDASATSFTSRLSGHDTSLAKLDASATSFTNRLDQDDLYITGLGQSIGRLDASGLVFNTRLNNLDASLNNSWVSFDASLNSNTLPTVTSITGKYKQLGNNVKCYIDIAISADSLAADTYLFALPITAPTYAYKNGNAIINTTGGKYTGTISSVINDTNNVQILVNSSPALPMTGTNPTNVSSIRIDLDYTI